MGLVKPRLGEQMGLVRGRRLAYDSSTTAAVVSFSESPPPPPPLLVLPAAAAAILTHSRLLHGWNTVHCPPPPPPQSYHSDQCHSLSPVSPRLAALAPDLT